MKKAQNTFTTLQVRVSDLKEEESDLPGLDGESHVDYFFLLKDNYHGLEPKENTTYPTLL